MKKIFIIISAAIILSLSLQAHAEDETVLDNNKVHYSTHETASATAARIKRYYLSTRDIDIDAKGKKIASNDSEEAKKETN